MSTLRGGTKMKCWDCNGTGVLETLAFQNKKLNGISSECERCSGAGEVPQEMKLWVERGKKMREKRIAMRIHLHKFAEKIECSPIFLSKSELGLIDPKIAEDKIEDWLYKELTKA